MITKFLGKYDNIESFSLEKDNFIFEIYIIPKLSNKSEISILIYPDKKISFHLFSSRLNLNKIRNIKGESLNLLDSFYKNKAIIEKFNESEIIIGIKSDEIYTNINLLKFDKKGKYILSISAKKNEYYVIWRDPNFESSRYYGKHLDDRKLFCIREANMNIQSFKSTEEALKFIIKRKNENDKIIYITSIGMDLSGKRFIEIVREIYKFDIMVLFYSNNKDHFNWIKDFPNCLYTDKKDIYEKYLTNYNRIGLKNLKKEVEEKYKSYNLKFKEFSHDFLCAPNEENIFNPKYNHYIRHVKIFCKNQNKYLCMKENGKVTLQKDFDNNCLWDATFLNQKIDKIINKTITLYSNNFYLKEEKGKPVGDKYMKVWNYKIFKIKEDNDNEIHYCFINPEKKNDFLSAENAKIQIINKEKPGKNESFHFEDIPELDDSLSNESDSCSFISVLSKQICDKIPSIEINDSKSQSNFSELIKAIDDSSH